jgi:hypothetical protein
MKDPYAKSLSNVVFSYIDSVRICSWRIYVLEEGKFDEDRFLYDCIDLDFDLNLDPRTLEEKNSDSLLKISPDHL